MSLALTLASKALAFAVALAWGRSTLAGFCLWDCNWYESILSGGYHWNPLAHVGRDAANWAFFPLLPLLAWPLHGLAGLSGETALVLTGTLLLPVCIYLFLALVEAHGIRVDPWSAGCLLAFNPYAIYAHAGYTEPLYFALAAGTLLALQRDRWAAAGLLGCAAASTRLVGLFLVLPMVERWLRKARQPRPAGSGPLDPVLAIALVPLGVALFGWHLRESTGDLLAFVHIQIAWGRIADNPLVVWWIAAGGSGRTRFFAVTAVLGLAAALALLRRGRIGDGLFLAAVILVPLQSGTGSMPRFVFWQPPFLLVLATLMQRPRRRRALLILFAAGSAAIDVAWFSGDSFVN
ncbi:MAG: hypothetical protein U1E53_11365 [Dongiaceae bacterium]